MRALVSAVALAIILLGARYAYGRERLCKSLPTWYAEDNARFFDGSFRTSTLGGAICRTKAGSEPLKSNDEGYLEIVLDRYALTPEAEARAVLRHEECHAMTWGEEPAHGPEFQKCKAMLEQFVEVRSHQ